MHRFIISLLTMGTLVAEPAYRLQPEPAKLLSPAITEASGLAVSPSDADFLWIINDSGGTSEIHLAATDGTPRGSVTIDKATNNDWEDLAAFMLDGKPYLLIGDIGDNGSVRKSCTLYIVREPALPAHGKSLSGSIPIAWEIRFTYEDGPRDCEALAVDTKGPTIILMNKRTKVPGVYALPLRAGENPVARKIGTTETAAPRIFLPIPFRNQPTGMDISADNRTATVVTYVGVFLFKRAAEESWADAFGRKPEFLGMHGLAQAESIAISKNGKRIFAISEKTNSPIARFEVVE